MICGVTSKYGWEKRTCCLRCSLLTKPAAASTGPLGLPSWPNRSSRLSAVSILSVTPRSSAKRLTSSYSKPVSPLRSWKYVAGLFRVITRNTPSSLIRSSVLGLSTQALSIRKSPVAMSHLAHRGRKAVGENICAVYANGPRRHISTAGDLSANRLETVLQPAETWLGEQL